VSGRETLVWEEISFFAECSVAALGDPRLVGDVTCLQPPLPRLHVRRSGYGMIYGCAECDDLPIEAARLGGEIIAVRIEFTTDVAELEAAGEGRWVPLGDLRIGAAGAVAVDHHHEYLQESRRQIPIAAGWYEASAFMSPADHLGIRIARRCGLRSTDRREARKGVLGSEARRMSAYIQRDRQTECADDG
jgi:hypothetical protein